MTNTLEKRKLVLDSLSQADMGMGGTRDKLDRVKAKVDNLSINESEEWYLSNGFIQKIVDIPAKDATREWITIKTNRDDLNISRIIQNRFSELQFPKKLTELIRYSRMYNLGGFLYYGIDHSIPQTDLVLEKPLPFDLNRIDYINVFSPLQVNILDKSNNPLAQDYSLPEIRINGIKVHSSRYEWLVHSFLPDRNMGVSAIQTVLDAAKSQGIALWSVTTLLSELSIKVFKSPDVNNADPNKLFELLALIRSAISTQGVFGAGENESLERLNANVPGLKDIFDFLIETLAGLSEIPKSRLLGQAQGTITGGQNDLISYYDSIAKFQEIELRSIIENAIKLIVKERSGEVYKALNGQVNSLDWEFEFNPLWKLTALEKADVELKQAQADDIYIKNAVVSPSEVRSKRFKDLEEFGDVKSENINFANNNLEGSY
jgi:phage-related protein (TIGR01555 family)